jgi:hypothetical protein
MAYKEVKLILPSEMSANTDLKEAIEANVRSYGQEPKTSGVSRVQDMRIEFQGVLYSGNYNRHFDGLVWEFKSIIDNSEDTDDGGEMSITDAVRSGIVEKKGWLYIYKGENYGNIEKLISANPRFTK